MEKVALLGVGSEMKAVGKDENDHRNEQNHEQQADQEANEEAEKDAQQHYEQQGDSKDGHRVDQETEIPRKRGGNPARGARQQPQNRQEDEQEANIQNEAQTTQSLGDGQTDADESLPDGIYEITSPHSAKPVEDVHVARVETLDLYNGPYAGFSLHDLGFYTTQKYERNRIKAESLSSRYL
jgi:hypothetical protein